MKSCQRDNATKIHTSLRQTFVAGQIHYACGAAGWKDGRLLWPGRSPVTCDWDNAGLSLLISQLLNSIDRRWWQSHLKYSQTDQERRRRYLPKMTLAMDQARRLKRKCRIFMFCIVKIAHRIAIWTHRTSFRVTPSTNSVNSEHSKAGRQDKG